MMYDVRMRVLSRCEADIQPRMLSHLVLDDYISIVFGCRGLLVLLLDFT